MCLTSICLVFYFILCMCAIIQTELKCLNVSGLKDVFAEMRHSAQEQQVAFAEIFNRVAFLQSFIMSETHTFSSLFYNALGIGASYLLTSVRRTAGAR